MFFVLIALLSVSAAFSAICCLRGFGSAGSLDTFHSDGPQFRRQFVQPVDSVMSAYRNGVMRTPGMRIAEERDNSLLVDLRPTSRIIGGNFGLAIKLDFYQNGPTSAVTAAAQDKVPWSLRDGETAFRHAETKLRMNAKRDALVEVI